jgi:hypothetical protein
MKKGAKYLYWANLRVFRPATTIFERRREPCEQERKSRVVYNVSIQVNTNDGRLTRGPALVRIIIDKDAVPSRIEVLEISGIRGWLTFQTSAGEYS